MKLAAWVEGTVHVDEMLKGMDENEFREWQAFDLICPIGPDLRDEITASYRAAALRYLGGLAGDSQANIDEIEPDKFCPWMQSSRPKPNPEVEAAAERANAESALILSMPRGEEYPE